MLHTPELCMVCVSELWLENDSSNLKSHQGFPSIPTVSSKLQRTVLLKEMTVQSRFSFTNHFKKIHF